MSTVCKRLGLKLIADADHLELTMVIPGLVSENKRSMNHHIELATKLADFLLVYKDLNAEDFRLTDRGRFLISLDVWEDKCAPEGEIFVDEWNSRFISVGLWAGRLREPIIEYKPENNRFNNLLSTRQISDPLFDFAAPQSEYVGQSVSRKSAYHHIEDRRQWFADEENEDFSENYKDLMPEFHGRLLDANFNLEGDFDPSQLEIFNIMPPNPPVLSDLSDFPKEVARIGTSANTDDFCRQAYNTARDGFFPAGVKPFQEPIDMTFVPNTHKAVEGNDFVLAYISALEGATRYYSEVCSVTGDGASEFLACVRPFKCNIDLFDQSKSRLPRLERISSEFDTGVMPICSLISAPVIDGGVLDVETSTRLFEQKRDHHREALEFLNMMSEGNMEDYKFSSKITQILDIPNTEGLTNAEVAKINALHFYFTERLSYKPIEGENIEALYNALNNRSEKFKMQGYNWCWSPIEETPFDVRYRKCMDAFMKIDALAETVFSRENVETPQTRAIAYRAGRYVAQSFDGGHKEKTEKVREFWSQRSSMKYFEIFKFSYAFMMMICVSMFLIPGASAVSCSVPDPYCNKTNYLTDYFCIAAGTIPSAFVGVPNTTNLTSCFPAGAPVPYFAMDVTLNQVCNLATAPPPHCPEIKRLTTFVYTELAVKNDTATTGKVYCYWNQATKILSLKCNELYALNDSFTSDGSTGYCSVNTCDTSSECWCSYGRTVESAKWVEPDTGDFYPVSKFARSAGLLTHDMQGVDEDMPLLFATAEVEAPDDDFATIIQYNHTLRISFREDTNKTISLTKMDYNNQTSTTKLLWIGTLPDYVYVNSGVLDVTIVYRNLTVQIKKIPIIAEKNCVVYDRVYGEEAWKNYECMPPKVKTGFWIYNVIVVILSALVISLSVALGLVLIKYGIWTPCAWGRQHGPKLTKMKISQMAKGHVNRVKNGVSDLFSVDQDGDTDIVEELVFKAPSIVKGGAGKTPIFVPMNQIVILSIISIIMISGATACSNTKIIDGKYLNCVNIDESTRTCNLVTTHEVTLTNEDREVCLAIQDENGIVHGMFTLNYQRFVATYEKHLAYYTSDFFPADESVRRCQGLGGCPDNCKNDYLLTHRSADTNIDDALVLNWPGQTTCASVVTGINDCANAKACIYAAYSLVPRGDVFTTYGVGTQSGTYGDFLWTLEGYEGAFVGSQEDQVVVDEDGVKVTLLSDMEDIAVQNEYACLTASSQFTKNYLGTCSEANAPEANKVGDIQSTTVDSFKNPSGSAFKYSTDIIASMAYGAYNASFVFEPSAISIIGKIAEKLPFVDTIGRYAWNNASKGLEIEPNHYPQITFAIDVDSSFTILQNEDLVCPECDFLEVYGCYDCKYGLNLRFNARSVCLEGYATVTTDADYVEVRTQAIKLSLESTEYNVTVFSSEETNDFNLIISYGSNQCYMPVNYMAQLHLPYIANQTTYRDQLADANHSHSLYDNSFFNWLNNFLTFKSAWWEYFVGSLIGLVLLIAVLVAIGFAIWFDVKLTKEMSAAGFSGISEIWNFIRYKRTQGNEKKIN